MSRPTKRPNGESGGSFHTAKKRKPNDVGSGNTNTTETVTNARHLQVLLTDLSSAQALQKGYQSFRNFLQGCVPDRRVDGVHGAVDGNSRTEADVVRNKAILREWVESEVQQGAEERKRKVGKEKKVGKEEQKEEGDEVEKWRTVVDGLGYASQVGLTLTHLEAQGSQDGKVLQR